MRKKSPVFEKNYDFYLRQLKNIDWPKKADFLGAWCDRGELNIPFLDSVYKVSEKGVFGEDGNRPSYGVCIVLFKYVLMDFTNAAVESEWTSYRDFRDAAPLTGFFHNDVEKPIAEHFSGKTANLGEACEKLGGTVPDLEVSHDVSFQFAALPKAPLLLLFNDADDEFPAGCSVLFKKSLEHFLDMESAAILAQIFSIKLIQTDKGD